MDHLKHLQSCKPLHNTDTAIFPSALSIVTPLLTHRWEEELSYHWTMNLPDTLSQALPMGSILVTSTIAQPDYQQH